MLGLHQQPPSWPPRTRGQYQGRLADRACVVNSGLNDVLQRALAWRAATEISWSPHSLVGRKIADFVTAWSTSSTVSQHLVDRWTTRPVGESWDGRVRHHQSWLARYDVGGLTVETTGVPFQSHIALIISAAFSAIMIVGALVLPRTTLGMTEASTTRRLSKP
jgi:hypothetical protein